MNATPTAQTPDHLRNAGNLPVENCREIDRELRALKRENANLRENLTLHRYSHDEIEAACGGEIALVVMEAVLKRRAAIIAESK